MIQHSPDTRSRSGWKLMKFDRRLRKRGRGRTVVGEYTYRRRVSRGVSETTVVERLLDMYKV